MTSPAPSVAGAARDSAAAQAHTVSRFRRAGPGHPSWVMWRVRSTANLVSGCGDEAFAAACVGHRSRPRRRTTERNYAMSTPVKAEVDDATKDALTGLALGDVEVLERALELRDAWQAQSGLDARAFSLVKIAALIA